MFDRETAILVLGEMAKVNSDYLNKLDALEKFNDLCISETERRNPDLSARFPWSVMNAKDKTDA